MKKTISILAAIIALSALSGCQKDSQTSQYLVNTESSRIFWKGIATDHFHTGSFQLNGNVSTRSDGTVTAGDFTIPVSSITNFDLAEPMKQKLLDDLKSANFFNIIIFPVTKFHLTAVEPYSKTDTTAIQGANYLLTGDFTMLGETHQVIFPARISTIGDSLITQASFNLDRTKFHMNIYNDPSKPLYIYPNVGISLDIRAGKTK